MKFLFLLAMKNLTRHKRRTIITSISIAAGVGLYILMDTMICGMQNQSKINLIKYEVGSAKILANGYFEERQYLPVDIVIEDPQDVIKTVEDTVPGAKAVPRISFSADMIIQGEGFSREASTSIKIIALDPNTDDRVYSLKKSVAIGNYLNGDPAGVLIGKRLANQIDADPGDSLLINCVTRYGVSQSFDLVIAGILDSGNPYADSGAIYMNLYYADSMLQMDGAVTEISLLFPDIMNVDKPVKKLTQAFKDKYPQYRVMDWNSYAVEHAVMAQADGTSNRLFVLLIFLIAAVGISNTMLMSVNERIRELGMMRALGMDDQKIRIAFTFESFGIGLVGSFFGLILGLLLNVWIIYIGIDMNAFLGDVNMGYRVSGIIRGMWSPPGMILSLVFGSTFPMVIAWFTSKRAVKSEITDALRHV